MIYYSFTFDLDETIITMVIFMWVIYLHINVYDNELVL